MEKKEIPSHKELAFVEGLVANLAGYSTACEAYPELQKALQAAAGEAHKVFSAMRDPFKDVPLADLIDALPRGVNIARTANGRTWYCYHAGMGGEQDINESFEQFVRGVILKLPIDTRRKILENINT